MADVELVLRFFAMFDFQRDQTITIKQITLKKYLNEYMSRMNKVDNETLSRYSSIFVESMSLIHKTIGKNAFRNLTKITEKKPIQQYTSAFHPAIFDAIGQAAAYIVENNIAIPEDVNYENAHKILLNNEDFMDCISVRTTNVDKIKRRINLAAQLLFNVHME